MSEQLQDLIGSTGHPGLTCSASAEFAQSLHSPLPSGAPSVAGYKLPSCLSYVSSWTVDTGAWYTMFALSLSGTQSFGFTKSCFKVTIGLKVTCTPMGGSILLTASEMPQT